MHDDNYKIDKKISVDTEPAETMQPYPNPNCYAISQMLRNILTSCVCIHKPSIEGL